MRADQYWFETSEQKLDHKYIIPVVTQRKEVKVGVMGFTGRASKELGEKMSNGLFEELHRLMALLRDGNLAILDFLEVAVYKQ